MDIDDVINLLLIYKDNTELSKLDKITEIKVFKERLLVHNGDNICQIPIIMLKD